MSGKPVTDDEVLEWWEAFEETRSITRVADRFRRSTVTVHKYLKHLGVLEPRQPREPRAPSGRTDVARQLDNMIDRIFEGRWTTEERYIAEALAKIPSMEERENWFEVRRDLPYAMSLPHTKKRHRKHVKIVQSERQRRQDRMGSAAEHGIIRAEMRRSGIL